MLRWVCGVTRIRKIGDYHRTMYCMHILSSAREEWSGELRMNRSNVTRRM